MTFPAIRLEETAAESPGAGRPSSGPAPSTNRLLIPLLGGIFAVLLIAGLRLASTFLVPIAIAALMTLLLGPLVRGMRKYGVAEPFGAAIIVFGTTILFAIAAVVLAGPAAEWLRRAPIALREVEGKLRSLEPITAIQETASSLSHGGQGTEADNATQLVQIVTPTPLKQLGFRTANVVAEMLTVIFLTYFLLAGGTMFRRKIAYLFPSGSHRTRIKRALFEIEEQMSRYLLINTLISVGFGVATWGLLAAIGMPNPVLWGAVAGLLNFIPYIGALVTVILIGVVSLASFDGTERMVLACGGFLLLDLIKGNLLSPVVLGRKMPLNEAAVFVSLLFWGWVWGIPGVIMAVPLTVMIQVITSHSERFRGVSILLGQWGSQRIT